MSKLLSLKLKDEIYKETENIRKSVKIPRNAYINKALEFFNSIQKRRLLKKQLIKESGLVATESLLVLNEFENLPDNFD